jgi:predicted O-methyltransferase YrrM
MFTLINTQVETYCKKHSSFESELLTKLNRETHLKMLRPRMLSGQLQGLLLAMISKMLTPKYILEIGTYTGYSALCLAEGLQEEGELHTIEIDEELEDFIHSFFDKSDFSSQIKLHIGDALTLIPKILCEWDLVFIDAEKEKYLDYYHAIFPFVRKGGFILVDNVLWNGKVVEELLNNDERTNSVLEFNNYIQNDRRVKNLLLPFRDGIMVIEKL